MSIFLNVLLCKWLVQRISTVTPTLRMTVYLMKMKSMSPNCLVLISSKISLSCRCTKTCPSLLNSTSTSLVLLHIIFCACVWAPHQRNQIIQWTITRILFFNVNVYPPYSNRLIDFDLLWLEDAFKFRVQSAW